MLTKERLKEARGAALACEAAANSFLTDFMAEARSATRGDDGSTERIRPLFGRIEDAWGQWDEICRGEVLECLNELNAGLSDPILVYGVPFPTAHEAAGHCVHPLRSLPAVLEIGLPDEAPDDDLRGLYEQFVTKAEADPFLYTKALEKLPKSLGWDSEALRMAIAAEWAVASRSLFHEPAVRSSLEDICGELTEGMERIVRFLWPRRYPTKWDTLAESCWSGGEAADSAIKKQLEQLMERLLENDITDMFVDVDMGRRSVNLIRPRLVDE